MKTSNVIILQATLDYLSGCCTQTRRQTLITLSKHISCKTLQNFLDALDSTNHVM